MSKIKLHATILLGAAMLLAGCAVLTVDVDVYKGPLANHEDVQMEQMAAMAIGAKPLLVELRDILEANYMNTLEPYELNMGSDPNGREPKSQLQDQLKRYRKYGRTDVGTRLRILRERDWYESEFVDPKRDEMGIRKSYFLDSNADHVNNILSLYENLGDEGDERYYTAFVRHAKQALKDYRTNYEVLRPESREAEEQLWKEVRLRKDSFEDEAKLLLGDGNKHQVMELAKEIEGLHTSYEVFCTDNRFRDVQTLFVRWNKIQTRLTKNQVKIPDYLQNASLLQNKDKELEASSNAGFRALAETSLVDFQAEHIFGLKGEKKDLFVSHVKKISRAFLNTNQALEHLWRVEMEAIIWLSNQPKKIGFDPEQRIYEIARASLEIIESRRIAVLNNLFKTVDPNMVNGFVQLKTEIPWYRKWKFEDYEKAKEQLLTKFREQPAGTARKLLNAHKCAIAMEKLTQESLTKQKEELGKKIAVPDDYVWYVSGWEFGLTQIPFDKSFRVSPDRVEAFRDPEDREEASRAEKIASEIMIRSTEGAFPTGAFGRGRLDEGLETLIEDYLKKATICDPNKEELNELRWARRQLQDALVRFAEKLLFVANNRSLMSPPKGDMGLLLGTVLGVYRLLAGEAVVNFIRERVPIPGWQLIGTEQYTRILQAVGNSILVQADALHQQEVHEDKLKDDLKSEIYAINHTLDQSPSCVIDRLLEALRAKRAKRENDLKQIERRKDNADKEIDQARKAWEAAVGNIENLSPEEGETYVTAMKTKQKDVMTAYSLLVDDRSTENLVLKRAQELAKEATDVDKLQKKTLAELATELKAAFDTKATDPSVPSPVKRLLSSTAAYLGAFETNITQEFDNAEAAYEEFLSTLKEDYSNANLLIELAQKATDAKEKLDQAEKESGSVQKALDDTKTELAELRDAFEAINDVKYPVLRKANEAGPNPSPRFVRELLRSTLENLCEEKSNSPEHTQYEHAIAFLNDQPLPVEPIVIDKSKLPPEATAKEVRDLWITLLEYEHDLAKRDGDEDRATEIMEAIKAAREKREGMIFIRPAMAYLRTSFPATSLQSNPNLTWDNMLGGHMTRSIPFAPQIGEFLNPDAKRDARITAEIDKQFWQNINRIRVAGGGFTNYAVVKDDIGNWYVKGYSANPKDVIQSAQNLALFAAGAPMGTNLLTPSNQRDGARETSETSSSVLQLVFDKYRDEYRQRTKQEYLQLYAMLNDPPTKVDKHIQALWDANMDIKSPSQIREALDTALEWSHTYYLKSFASELKKDEADPAIQRERIVEGIRRLNQFRNDLTWKITNLKTRMDPPTDSIASPAGLTTDEEIQRAQRAAKAIVKKVLNDLIRTLLANRKDAIKIYEDALTVLAEATEQKE